MEPKLVKDIIREEMQAKGFTPVRIRRETGIAERYILAFIEGDEKKLPAVPYVRGYLIVIARLLGLDGNELWEAYEAESDHMKRSGALDILPGNRFALKKIKRTWIVGGVAVLLAIIYAALNIPRFLGLPTIIIEAPHEGTTVSTETPITLLGRIDPRDLLTIGGEEVPVESDGRFTRSYPLEPGLNTIEFSVRKLLGRETKVIRQVIYEPAVEPKIAP